jgi:magnesium-transporting ATPase (P-type)
MADTHGATGTHSSNTSSDNPNHLNTTIESGTFDEKTGHHDTAAPAVAKKPVEDEEEDEDMDALIDELESQDGHQEEEEGEEEAPAGTGRVVPEDQLQTDTRIGLTESEVHARRKKYGMNQMKEEKENMILKFLGYFIGPIQFVMEVSLALILVLSFQFLPPIYQPAQRLFPMPSYMAPAAWRPPRVLLSITSHRRPAQSHVFGLGSKAPRRENFTDNPC